MRKMFLLVALCCMTMLQATVYTPSSVPDPKKQGQDYYVSDPDGIIVDSLEHWTNICAQNLYAATKVELAVVALESIGDMDAFDFSYELFQRWGIGGKDRNTGVLMLFVLDSHDIRIMTGTGIEGVLTDAKCSKIIHDEMIPLFKKGAYSEGIFVGAVSIYNTCTDGEVPEELLNMRSVTNRGIYGSDSGRSSDDDDEDGEGKIGTIVVGSGVVLLIILAAIFGRAKCPKCKKRKTKSIRSHTLVMATYTHSGKKEVTYRCKNCGNVFTVIETIPKLARRSSSSSGGGSYGGGGGSWGGGSTSGGGAGGKW